MKKAIVGGLAALALVLVTAASCLGHEVLEIEMTGEGSADIRVVLDGKTKVDDRRILPFLYPPPKGTKDIIITGVSIDNKAIRCEIHRYWSTDDRDARKVVSEDTGTHINCGNGRDRT